VETKLVKLVEANISKDENVKRIICSCTSIWVYSRYHYTVPVPQRRKGQRRNKRSDYSLSVSDIAKFIVPDWGDKVDSGIGLSYPQGYI
jgi:hypothetical protein